MEFEKGEEMLKQIYRENALLNEIVILSRQSRKYASWALGLAVGSIVLNLARLFFIQH